MVKIDKVAVAIDFSDASRQALEMGRLLADASGASLHLVHVVNVPVGEPETLDQACGRCRNKLESLLTTADHVTRHATTTCLVGSVAAELVDFTTRADIDVIVMGTHRHGASFQMATGSVAESVLGRAPCAVLAVKKPAVVDRASFGGVVDDRSEIPT